MEESKTSWVISSPWLSPRIQACTSRMSGRSLLYSSIRALLKTASEGPVGAVVLVSSASGSFRTLEGVAPSLELLVMVWWLRFRSPRGSLTLRLRGGGTSSEGGSSALPESVSEAPLLCSGTCSEGCEVLGVGSSCHDASGLDPPSSGLDGADGAPRSQAEGSAFNTTGA